MEDARRDFAGAKLLLFLGEDLLALWRDHAPGIAWPGALDLPGGFREPGEDPETCVLRETAEEVGLRLARADLQAVTVHRGMRGPAWIFAAHLPSDLARQVRFGGEGAGWEMMAPRRFASHPQAIPHFAAILGRYLDGRDAAPRGG